MEKHKNPTFADSICDLRTRKIKATFFTQINKLMNWTEIKKIFDKNYRSGKSAVGTPFYDGLLLFKLALLQNWYGISGYEIENRLNDRISFGYFCGMTIE